MSDTSDDVYVFLGPSLPVEQARDILDATFLPPVSVGDVVELVLDKTPPRAIGIVDGLFEQVPAVWHKEILYAISQGTRVFGASSMGALRAAELHRFGMVGVGGIFEAFRDGSYTDDDEVAIVHAMAEDGYRPLSDAMVNLRAGVAAAVADGVLGEASAEVLLAEAKAMFYPSRSWRAVCAAGGERGLPQAELDALLAFVKRTRPDAKRDDAAALLRHMADVLACGEPAPAPNFELERTYYWEKLCRTVRNGRQAAAPVGDERDALLRLLLDQEAQRLGLLVDDGPDGPDRDSTEDPVYRAMVRRHGSRLARRGAGT